MYMKNDKLLLITVLTCSLILAYTHDLSAGVKGTLMGNLETVVSNGPLDAGRNPALLTTRTGENSAALYLLFRAYEINDATERGTVQEYDVPRGYAADIVTGFSTRIGSSVFGISIESNENGSQYEKGEADITMVNNSTGYELKSKTSSTNPLLNTSLGIPLDSSSSIGFQLRTGFSYQKEEVDLTVLSTGSSIDIDTNKKSVLLELGFGYLQSTGNSQVGVYITSGIVQFQWADYEFNIPVTGVSERYSQHNYFKYTRGMSISAGGYRQLTQMIGVAFEAGYVFPYSYKYTQYKFVGGTDPGEDQAVSVSSEGVIVMNGGVSFTLDSSLSLSAGLLYTRSRRTQYDNATTTNSEKEMKHSKYNVWLCTVGAEYTVAPNMIFSVGSIILRTNYDNEEENRSSSSSDGNMDFSMTSWKFDVALGMTYTF